MLLVSFFPLICMIQKTDEIANEQTVHGDEDDDSSDDDDDSDDPDLGIVDANNAHGNSRQSTSTEHTNNTNDSTLAGGDSSTSVNQQNKRTEERKHRGRMQWRPARNAKFAKSQTRLGLQKLKHKFTGGLEGRQPGVESGKFGVLLFFVVRIITNF